MKTCICKVVKALQGIRSVLRVEDIRSRENAMLLDSGYQFEPS